VNNVLLYTTTLPYG